MKSTIDIDDILMRDYCTDYDRQHFTQAGQILIAQVRLHVECSKSNIKSVHEYSAELIEEIRKAIADNRATEKPPPPPEPPDSPSRATY